MNGNGPSWGTLLSWFQVLGTVAALIAVFGELRGTVAQNTKDIQALQAQSATTADKLTDIRLDVKDIKARFEILVPTSSLERGQK